MRQLNPSQGRCLLQASGTLAHTQDGRLKALQVSEVTHKIGN